MQYSKTKIFFRLLAIWLLVVTYGLLITLSSKKETTKLGNAFAIAILLIINYLVSSSICLYIINSKRAHAIKIAWIYTIFLLPILGQLLFLILGVSGIKRKNFWEWKRELSEYNQYEDYTATKVLTTNHYPLRWRNFIFLANACQRPVYHNNLIKFHNNAVDSLQSLIQILTSAKKFIHIEYYYIANELVWKHVVNILVAKIQAGVEVRVIVDYFGNLKYLKRKEIQRLRKLGIDFRLFNPPFMKKLPISFWNFRCHKKFVIVDNKYAIYGSANIADEYYGISQKTISVDDYTYYLEGEIVNSINLSFAIDWDHSTKNPHKTIPLINCPQKYFQIHKPKEITTNTMVQVGQSGPDLEEKIIISNMIQMINAAKKRIWIATPYFMPPPSLLDALITAAYSGIEIKILLPREAVHFKKIITVMTKKNYQKLLAAQIKIYEYQGFNHEKTILVDYDLVYTGSYNWDYRSLLMNYETILQISSQEINYNLQQAYLKRLSNSQEITQNHLKQIYRWPAKIISFIMQIVYPII